MKNSLREKVFEYVAKKYKSKIEYPWQRYPNFAIFRHNDNKKWFGLIGDVAGTKLGLSEDEKIDILNVKINDHILLDMLVQQNGILPAYHMNKENWISILLDGSVSLEQIFELVDLSFVATASKKTLK